MTTEHSKETRILILEAAYKVFGSHGFDGTSMKLIAKEAGIVPGSIYNYFTDKEELFTCAVKAGWEEFITAFIKIETADSSPAEKFGDIIELGFDLLKRAQPLLKGMLFGANQRQLVQENLDRLLDSWERIITEDMKQGAKQAFGKEQRRALIKYIVMGVLLAVALVHPDNIDQELAKIKNEIRILVTR
jgi:TetR/AcrR family transcriptional regulator, mexJK operon transcriptional repressor